MDHLWSVPPACCPGMSSIPCQTLPRTTPTDEQDERRLGTMRGTVLVVLPTALSPMAMPPEA